MKNPWKTIAKLLENGVEWPQSIDTRKLYKRTHDDCDGDLSEVLQLVFSQDGDAWVFTQGYKTLRFRAPFGGSMSPRVHVALLILAFAINMENQKNPVPRPSEVQLKFKFD